MLGEAKDPEVDKELENAEDDAQDTESDGNVLVQCALKGSLVRLTEMFDNEDDEYHEKVAELLDARDEEARSPLDVAALLGRTEIIKELLTRGASINNASLKGMTCLHKAANWNKIEAVKLLIENGADMQMRTTYGERARETALRYNHHECVDYLDWAEAREALIKEYTVARETLADPEKVLGRFSRDDKNVINNACNEKQTWLESNPEATTQDFITMKAELEQQLAPVFLKLTEPPKTPKRG